MITKIDFRNYANDLFSIDTGTLAGLERYIEWVEELICNDEKLQLIKTEIDPKNKEAYQNIPKRSVLITEKKGIVSIDINNLKPHEIVGLAELLRVKYITETLNSTIK